MLSGPAAAMPILFAVAISLAMLIILPLLYLLFACIEFAFAKLLGGKAGFEKHFSASALTGLAAFSVVLPITITEAALEMAAVIPFLSCCIAPFSIVFGIASLLISLYALYLRFIAFRKVHELTDMKAAAVVALPLILSLIHI